MKSKFNFRRLCESLTKKFERDSNKQNIIKLSVDISIPNEFYGSPEVCEKLLKLGYEYFANKLINGIIKIEIVRQTELMQETTLMVKISGTDNIQNSENHNLISLIKENELLGLQNEFKEAEYIQISSEGSTLLFQITLQNIESSTNKKQALNLKDKKILIAEDNEINAMVFSSFLEEWGCHSSFAINGLEALQMVQEDEYDLILMDIHMPVLNGIQATKKIREFNKNIPIVALTASDLEQDFNGAQIAGISDYLIKPISSQLLHSVISKCLLDAIDEF
ncbi:MAG: response regulator [Bacteroidota bacterium]